MLNFTRLTFREMFHRRVFLIALLLTVLFLVLYGTALHFAYKDPVNDPVIRKFMATQLTSVGLYLSSFIVAFLAVLGSVGAISGDIESGVIQAVLVKPFSRWEVVLGKFCGLALIMIIYAAFFFLSVTGLNIFFSNGIITFHINSILQSMVYYCGMPLILLAVSLWGSSFLPTLNNGIMVVMLYSFSTIGGILEQVGYLVEKQGLINIGIISSLLMPVDAIYRKMLNTLYSAASSDLSIFADGFFTGKHEPSMVMVIYTCFYGAFFLWRASRVFAQRDI